MGRSSTKNRTIVKPKKGKRKEKKLDVVDLIREEDESSSDSSADSIEETIEVNNSSSTKGTPSLAEQKKNDKNVGKLKELMQLQKRIKLVRDSLKQNISEHYNIHNCQLLVIHGDDGESKISLLVFPNYDLAREYGDKLSCEKSLFSSREIYFHGTRRFWKNMYELGLQNINPLYWYPTILDQSKEMEAANTLDSLSRHSMNWSNTFFYVNSECLLLVEKEYIEDLGLESHGTDNTILECPSPVFYGTEEFDNVISNSE